MKKQRNRTLEHKFVTDLNRKKGEYSRVEKRLVKEIQEVYRLIFYGVDKIKASKYLMNWESSALLSNDRNNLIRLGVISEATKIESWINWIVINNFIDGSLYTYRHKKYKLFEKKVLGKLNLASKIELVLKITAIPPHIKTTLNELRKIRNCMAHEQFPGLETSDERVLYQRRNILDLNTFKNFLRDCDVLNDFLMEKATGLRP
ncbi:MAG: hypothetical protein WC133_00035 [Candidatus Omnitrophota bacterium]